MSCVWKSYNDIYVIPLAFGARRERVRNAGLFTINKTTVENNTRKPKKRMKFCKFCDNMLYIRLDDAPKNDDVADDKVSMLYFCKSCGWKDAESQTQDSTTCVLDNNYLDDYTNYQQYVTKNIVHDATLPHIHHLPCTNPKCTRKPDQPNDVIFVKYDSLNMKYLYYCCHCQLFWKST